MGDLRAALVSVALLAVCAAAFAWHAAAPEAPGRPALTPQPLRFAAGTTHADRQAILQAVAAARPEARRLVDLVAGVTTVGVGTAPGGGVGEARGTKDGFVVTLDLRAAGTQGVRGIHRVVLHELGHVVDHVLVPDELDAQLDAATPRGWGCDDGGHSGACASREERFAESFAKWATGDIGAGIYLGYRVPPPAPNWGAPLSALR